MNSLLFTIPGRPVGKERARSDPTGRHRTPPKTRAYEALVAVLGHNAMVQAGWKCGGPNDWFRLSLAIHFGPGSRPDCSNVIKSIEDGLNKVVWHDDRTVVPSVLDVYLEAIEPRVVVLIEPICPRD